MFQMLPTTLAVLFLAASQAQIWLPLTGEWRFALDPNNEGLNGKWFETPLKDRILLPGTTDERRKGAENPARETGRLTRLYPYAGPAWYQRDLTVPPAWSGKHVVLFLERTKTSRVWLDSAPLGTQDSLVAPHRYTLPNLAPGLHRLTIRIDNADHAPLGDPHQISDQTQTNWNGIIGRIGLFVGEPVWIEDVQVYAEFESRKVAVRIEVGNATGKPVSGTLSLNAPGTTPVLLSFSADGDRATVEDQVVFRPATQGWDEFKPVLQKLTVALEASGYRDRAEVSFGLRTFAANGSQFKINGRPVFLRGRVDNCVFPLTGYPPMTAAGWLHVFTIAKAYGLNHFRFHSWFPPEAAFEAADKLGVYLQPELPNWAAFGDARHDEFLRAEGERILRAFGNHPSFVMLSLGNELGGKQELMAPFVRHFRELDSRHLYAQGSNNWFPWLAEGDDYWTTFQVRGKRVRGSYATVDPPLGHVQTGPPSTLTDYREAIAGVPVPVIGHEIGQYQVAPDFRELGRYSGVLRPRNLEIFRERLEKQGLRPQAEEFFRASGELAVICYREDIEAALRTPGFGGFQLLDLQDFPGQGTALVGLLNSLLEPKGLIDPVRWREFCSDTVPLVRMAKYVWTQGETFSAAAEVAHYGPADLNLPANWTLRDAAGHKFASGRLPGRRIPVGAVTPLGKFEVPLQNVPAPVRLTLDLALGDFRNSYPLWVYPNAVSTAPGGVVVSRTLEEARPALAAGRRVLLAPDPAALTDAVEGAWASDFWNWGMFRRFALERKMPVAPGTLGILCEPKHPAFAAFPTEFHSNWQWFHLLEHSRAVVLDAAPAGYRPLVQVIDNYERAHRLGVVFEARVGPGKLLVSTIDLLGQKDRPEARQLLFSLLGYMNSAQFAPGAELDPAFLAQALRP